MDRKPTRVAAVGAAPLILEFNALSVQGRRYLARLSPEG